MLFECINSWAKVVDDTNVDGRDGRISALKGFYLTIILDKADTYTRRRRSAKRLYAEKRSESLAICLSFMFSPAALYRWSCSCVKMSHLSFAGDLSRLWSFTHPVRAGIRYMMGGLFCKMLLFADVVVYSAWQTECCPIWGISPCKSCRIMLFAFIFFFSGPPGSYIVSCRRFDRKAGVYLRVVSGNDYFTSGWRARDIWALFWK